MGCYTSAILSAYILVVVTGYLLDYLNLSHLRKHGDTVPPEFEGKIDPDFLRKTRDYTVEKTYFGFVSSIVNNIVLLAFLFGGLLDIYNSWIHSLKYPFILSGLLFFLLLVYAESALSIPFSLYSTFRIEKKYGFNTMTLRLWVMDLVKSLLISTVLICLLISAGLFLVQKSPGFWWFWVWCFFLVFGIFIMYISPYLIEPLFNRFSPLEDEALEGDIRALMQKAGIKVSRIFKMDASRRTRHTNAYFTGIGRVKRIVFYDTLLEKMNKGEILSVLAHEAGHWKKKHLLKTLIVTETVALVLLYTTYRMVQGDLLTDLFNISTPTLFAKVVLTAFIGSIVLFPLGPVFNCFSRRHELEADSFSCEMTGDPESMISALVKLSKDNLTNLHPHPLYAFFYYSHPPVLERIRRIRELSHSAMESG
jgi:STE24 endopeptidase